jgi:hypothetical protein
MAPPQGADLQLEARSAADGAWYDCALVFTSARPMIRFVGYGSEDDEPLRSLRHLRFSSLATEPSDCPAVRAGAAVTAFRRSPEAELWVDATVAAKRPGAHARGAPCDCCYTVAWADAQGQTAVGLQDICMLDPRPLEAHPDHARVLAALGRSPRKAAAPAAAASLAAGGGRAAGGARPRPRGPEPPGRAEHNGLSSEEDASDSSDSSESSSSEEEAEEAAEEEEAAAAAAPPPRAAPAPPPPRKAPPPAASPRQAARAAAAPPRAAAVPSPRRPPPPPPPPREEVPETDDEEEEAPPPRQQPRQPQRQPAAAAAAPALPLPPAEEPAGDGGGAWRLPAAASGPECTLCYGRTLQPG